MQEKTFLEEQNELFEKFIFDDIYSTFKLNMQAPAIELYITTDCNKDCEYCYLQKNKDSLYPIEYRNKEKILKNLEIFLNFLISKEIKLTEIQLYSGEIWGTDFGFQIFDTLLKSRVELITPHIIIPSNCSFVNNNDILLKMYEYILLFNSKKVDLFFSISYDGLITENENRPFKDSNLALNQEDFSNKLFKFAQSTNVGFHPMISAFTIEKQIDNFDWWAKKCEEIGWSPIEKVMMLEVRNDDWTKEKIIEYLKWLNYITQYTFRTHAKNDLFDMLKIIVNKKEIRYASRNYLPFVLRNGANRISCNLTNHHSVRLGDLAIVPCHRLAYDKLLYGKYRVENDKITGIDSINPTFAFQNYLLNNYGSLKCDSCPINVICTGQCRGAAFEISKEPFYPIESVCDLERAKFTYCLLYLEELVQKTKFYEFNARTKEERQLIERVNYNLDILNKIRLREEYQEWMELIPIILKSNP